MHYFQNEPNLWFSSSFSSSFWHMNRLSRWRFHNDLTKKRTFNMLFSVDAIWRFLGFLSMINPWHFGLRTGQIYPKYKVFTIARWVRTCRNDVIDTGYELCPNRVPGRTQNRPIIHLRLGLVRKHADRSATVGKSVCREIHSTWNFLGYGNQCIFVRSNISASKSEGADRKQVSVNCSC